MKFLSLAFGLFMFSLTLPFGSGLTLVGYSCSCKTMSSSCLAHRFGQFFLEYDQSSPHPPEYSSAAPWWVQSNQLSLTLSKTRSQAPPSSLLNALRQHSKAHQWLCSYPCAWRFRCWEAFPVDIRDRGVSSSWLSSSDFWFRCRSCRWWPWPVWPICCPSTHAPGTTSTPPIQPTSPCW